MKILIIGATGTIGTAVSTELQQRYHVIKAGSSSGDVRLDIEDAKSIEQFFAAAGPFDALVCTAGAGYWGPFASMNEDNFYKGIKSKLMGQINLVRIGQHFINSGGSFTLTSGILADDPVAGGVNLSVASAAINGFVQAVAPELQNGIRINAVSPGLVQESAEQYGPFFPGHVPVAMSRVVAAYTKSIEGIATGQVFRVH